MTKIIISTIIKNSDNEILLGKRSEKEEVFPGLWGIPGGKVEFVDTLPHVLEQNLVREVKEEMGIEIKPTRYLTSNFNSDGSKLYIIFESEFLSGKPEPLEDTSEVRWFTPDECSKLEMTPNTYENILEAFGVTKS